MINKFQHLDQVSSKIPRRQLFHPEDDSGLDTQNLALKNSGTKPTWLWQPLFVLVLTVTHSVSDANAAAPL
jgi:hypothetical protein